MLPGVCAIYEAAISTSERKPVDALAAMAGRGDYRIDVAKVGDDVAGFGVWFVPPDEPIALLEYLAVDEPFRGSGLGAALLRRGLADAGRTTVVEVESECPEGEGAEHRRRRIGFYRRLGCRRVLGLTYQLPLCAGGQPPPMELFLNRHDSDTPLPRGVLARWLGVIYERVYGQAADDPRITEMMRGVDDPVRLD
jgi:GNAT superfamily N-acetyltransferase